MAVNLSPVGGVAAQFFTSTGAVLTGGKLYTYAAGTTTPAVTYTSSDGLTPWTNPVVLDAAGRVPGSGEIWLTDGIIYKFVLKDSNDVLIATYDNITGINSNSVSYTNQQEIVTATAGQTVFDLSINYAPGTNSLSVFVDGVNQYGPGALYSYVETDSNTVTFNSGLHVGAEVKFTTTQQQGAGAVDASQVSYDPPYVDSVATNVEAKLAQIISVMDFGAVGDGVTDDTDAFKAAIATNDGAIYVPSGVYRITETLVIDTNVTITGFPNVGSQHNQYSVIYHDPTSTGPLFTVTSGSINGASIKNLKIYGGNGSFCIVSSNEYCEYELINMEPYTGGGIQLLSTGSGSSSTKLLKCQWVGPNSQTAYTGFEINVSGGDVWMDGCTAIRGAKGINVLRGQTIMMDKVSLNAQSSTYSSLSILETGGIFLSGSLSKQAINIRGSYIEDCANGISAEYCQALLIEGNHIADTGAGSWDGSNNGAMIRIKSNVFNTTVVGNQVYAKPNGIVAQPYYSYVINGANNTYFLNNYLYYSGSNAGIFNINASSSKVWVLGDYYYKDTFTPVANNDAGRILVDLDPANGSAPLKFTSLVDTSWLTLYPITANAIYKVYVSDINTAGSQYTEATVLTDISSASSVSYQIQTATDGNKIEVQVSGGNIQIRAQTAQRLDRIAVMRIG